MEIVNHLRRAVLGGALASTPEPFAAAIGSELKKWSAVIRQTGIWAD